MSTMRNLVRNTGGVVDDNQSTVNPTNRALERIGLAGVLAWLGALVGFGKIAWNSWNGSASSQSLCNWIIGLAAVGVVCEVVDTYWQRSRPLVALAFATVTIFYIRMHEPWATALAGGSQRWTDADWWSWTVAFFAMSSVPPIALRGILAKEAAWDERRRLAGGGSPASAGAAE